MAINRRELLYTMLAASLAGATESHAKTSVSRKAITLAALLQRHTQARGGAAALDSIHSLTTDLWITESASTVVGRYRCSDQPAYRIDIYSDAKHVFCEGLDADGPWIWREDQPAATAAVPDAKRTALQGIEFNLIGLHAFARRGHKLQLLGLETVEHTDYYLLQVDMKDSYRTFLYIDPATWLVARRRDFRSFHPDMTAEKKFYENRYYDQRIVDGITTSFLQEQFDLEAKQAKAVTLATSLTYNPELPPHIFDRTTPRPPL